MKQYDVIYVPEGELAGNTDPVFNAVVLTKAEWDSMKKMLDQHMESDLSLRKHIEELSKLVFVKQQAIDVYQKGIEDMKRILNIQP